MTKKTTTSPPTGSCRATTSKGARCKYEAVTDGLCLLHASMRDAVKAELL